jgi:hypothetical protein
MSAERDKASVHPDDVPLAIRVLGSKEAMRIRAIPNLLLSAVGLRVVPSELAQKRFPVEIASTDEDIYRYVRERKLATASDERLFATIMACRHVVQAGVPGDFVECGVWRGTNSILAPAYLRICAQIRPFGASIRSPE